MKKELSAEHNDILLTLISMEKSNQLSGIYSDVPIEVYHHTKCPAYSSTTLKRIIERSYNHWFFAKDDSSTSLKIGSAFHAFVDDAEQFKNDFAVSSSDDKRSPEYKKTVKENLHKQVLSWDEFQLISSMEKKLLSHPDARQLIEGSTKEQTFFAQDPQTGLWLKCRADLYNKDSMQVSDFKTCQNASESAFVYDAKKYLYRVSAAHYLNVISLVTGLSHRNFNLIACEKESPNDIAVYRVDERSISRGEDEIRAALNIIDSVNKRGDEAWTGYVLGIKDIVI